MKNNRLIGIIVIILALFTIEVRAGNQQDIPADEHRGSWFDTIDEDARSYAYTKVYNISRKGPSSLRFELRDGDCYTAVPENPASGWDACTRDRDRTEVRERWEPQLDTDTWYSFSVYTPSDYQAVYPKQMIFQWHNGVWGPNAFFEYNRNKFNLNILTEEHTTTYNTTLGQITRGKWIDVVVNVNWTNKNTGYLRVYINGELVHEHNGPTMDDAGYASGHGPHVKYGIYVSHKFRWEGPGPRPTHVLYFDEYRRGYSYRDVNINNYEGD